MSRQLRSEAEARAHIEAISAELDAKGVGNALNGLLPLTSQDCAIIGVIVQMLAFCDFNARRALEVIDHVENLEVRPINRDLRENEVLPTLLARSVVLPLGNEERRNLAVAIEALQRMQHVRHHLVHWAAKRHPSADVLVATTLNRREAFRKAEHEPEAFKATYAVIPMPEVRANLKPMEANTEFLAQLAARWWLNVMPDNWEFADDSRRGTS